MYKQFIPKDLSVLLEYISPAAFNVIDWKTAAKKYIFSPKTDKYKESIIKRMQAEKHCFRPGLEFHSQSADSIPQENHLRAYETTLDLYFSQLYAGEVLFLDLRPKFFSQDGDKIIFSPGKTIVEIEPKFRQALINLYEGFYLSLIHI